MAWHGRQFELAVLMVPRLACHGTNPHGASANVSESACVSLCLCWWRQSEVAVLVATPLACHGTDPHGASANVSEPACPSLCLYWWRQYESEVAVLVAHLLACHGTDPVAPVQMCSEVKLCGEVKFCGEVKLFPEVKLCVSKIGVSLFVYGFSPPNGSFLTSEVTLELGTQERSQVRVLSRAIGDSSRVCKGKGAGLATPSRLGAM
nr:hypothetical protein [Tanacetum cinerariifolium]